MHIPTGGVEMDLRSVSLVQSVEVSASIARSKGKEDSALALFRLRAKIREGLPYGTSKQLFENIMQDFLKEDL